MTLFAGFEMSAGPLTLSAAAGTHSPFQILSDTIDAVEAHANRVVVLAMDEVPIAVQSIVRSDSPESAGQLLSALRNLRQRTTRVRWIVAGSVGFHHILRIAGVTEGALNDLEPLALGPLTISEARELAERLLAGIGRTGSVETLDALSEQASRIPFIMHRIATALHATNGDGPVEAAHVGVVFDEFINDRDASRSLTHLVTRLDDFYGHRLPIAKIVLSHLAENLEGQRLTELCEIADSDEDAMRDVINDLVDDHYLVLEAGQFVWRYDVLRRIWIARMYMGNHGGRRAL